ncbi:hypothetical protein CY34DRAFT_12627 [Suillus luteus UH-Slu-Lm8-n1]|uniref:Uncharacterized protein n=1 Tax=Suillus luteus UH-Slu-Lm8-n1 TaxID=930992 RepID=A0A0D0AJQ0_9AGAM|nr:hypothetical protein CY34DRAFT_12627 [Suillus luteus UH-Slu-Lm8-n1]
MFKRVEKKRKKLEEEEELGIDEDMKEFMGINDTDSDESASDSDSSSDEHSGADQLQSGEEDLEENGEEDGDEMDDDAEPPILLSEALRDPVYVVSLDPDVRACILCKGKVIKGTQMSTVHKASIAHTRRFERFKTLAAKCDPQSDAWQIARTVQKEASNPTGTQSCPDVEGGMSKRALKRSAKLASIKEKRTLHNKLRAKAKAKKAADKVSSSQEAAGKESSASKTLVKQKSQKAGAATSDNKSKKRGEVAGAKVHNAEKSDASLVDKRTAKKGEQKSPISKPQNVEKLDVSPPKPSEPLKKKRKVQKDQVVTPSAPPRSPKQSQEKPLRKPKALREKRTAKS